MKSYIRMCFIQCTNTNGINAGLHAFCIGQNLGPRAVDEFVCRVTLHKVVAIPLNGFCHANDRACRVVMNRAGICVASRTGTDDEDSGRRGRRHDDGG